jgi:hypothetical protein
VNITRTTAALAAAALALTLGCGLGDDDNRAGIDTVAPVTTASSGPAAQPDAALPMDGKTAQTYKDGLKVALTAPVRYRVPATAAGHTAGNSAFAFNVIVVNGNTKPLDLTLSTLEVTVGADGVTAEQVYAAGLDSLMDAGTLAPGRRKTIKLAFSADTTDLTVIDVTVKPGFLDYTEALFTGRVAR